MSHNIADRQSELLQCPLYMANPVFLDNVGWQSHKVGNILIEKDANCAAICTIVGRVLDRRLNCSADGNYLSKQYGSFSSAKFHLLLSKPHGTPFADDFDTALGHIRKLQTQIASTKMHKNFVVEDALNKNLRFTQNVFEKRSPPIAPTTQAGDVIMPSVVDDDTENWPVRYDLRDDLNKIKYDYRASLLPVYIHDRFVEPQNVQDTLRGALVLLQFELHHFDITRAELDSFNSTIEQIEVLQPGEARPLSALKRKAGCVRDGPIRMRPPPQLRSGATTRVPVAGPSTIRTSQTPSFPAMANTALTGSCTSTPRYILLSLPLTEPAFNGDCNAADQSTSITTPEHNKPPADSEVRTTKGKGKQRRHNNVRLWTTEGKAVRDRWWA